MAELSTEQRESLDKEDDCPQAIADALVESEFYYKAREGWWSSREAGIYHTWEELAVRAILYAWIEP